MAWKSPATTGSPSNDWTNGTFIKTSNNQYATETTLGDQLDTSDYSFSNLTASGAFLTFDGLEVSLEAKSDDVGGGCPGVGSNHVVEVAISTDGGTTYSRTTREFTFTCPGESTKTVGSSTDKWGLICPDFDCFSNTNFRCRLELTEKNIGADTFSADHIQCQVSSHQTRFVNAGGFYDRSTARVVYAG